MCCKSYESVQLEVAALSSYQEEKKTVLQYDQKQSIKHAKQQTKERTEQLQSKKKLQANGKKILQIEERQVRERKKTGIKEWGISNRSMTSSILSLDTNSSHVTVGQQEVTKQDSQ